MTWVALAEAAALVVALVSFGQLLRSQQRSHSRREDLLLNQLLHAVGKPWQPAPAEERTEQPEPEHERFTASPEQYLHV